MNVLDFIIISVMTFFGLRGIFRGLIREIASLSGLIVGILMAIRVEPKVTEYLRHFFPSLSFVSIVSFCLIFFSILIFFNIIGRVLKFIIKKSSLGWIDRILGAGLALAKGVIIIYILIILLTFFLPAQSSLISGSTLAPIVVVSYQSMTGLIPQGVMREWKKKIQGSG